MSADLPGSPREGAQRPRYERPESAVRGGAIGIALVTAATAALASVAGLIAVIVAALY